MLIFNNVKVFGIAMLTLDAWRRAFERWERRFPRPIMLTSAFLLGELPFKWCIYIVYDKINVILY